MFFSIVLNGLLFQSLPLGSLKRSMQYLVYGLFFIANIDEESISKWVT